MGLGIELAREDAPLHAAVMDEFKDQLLIVFLKRLAPLGTKLKIPLSELDATGGFALAFAINQDTKEFTFEIKKAS